MRIRTSHDIHVADVVGTITTVSDLLGRTSSYTDVWGTKTEPVYEALTGRVLSVTTTVAGGSPSTQAFEYDLDGKVELVKLNGTTIDDQAYASNQLLQSVAYLNGTSLSSILRNANTGSTDGMTWTLLGTTVSHPAVGAYAGDFESGVDSWTAGTDDTTTAGVTTPHAGVGVLATATTDPVGGTVSVTRTITGMTVGRAYTLSAWVNTDTATGVSDTTVGVDGVGSSAQGTPGTGWAALSYAFTATATSHDLLVNYTAVGDLGSTVLWDGSG